MKALVISAPHSGAGKTMITLGLARALRDADVDIAAAKSGPDYIDPRFHEAATGTPSVNLDAWAMSPEQIRGLAGSRAAELLLVEGAMGLFDGAPDTGAALGRGSTADVAAILGAPVVMVLDVAAQAQSAAAVLQGFAGFRPDVRIAGAILNRVGSERHVGMIRKATDSIGLPVVGAVPRMPDLSTPSRHLGLVQAGERGDLEQFIDGAAKLIAAHVDLDHLTRLFETVSPGTYTDPLPPLGQRIAIASDVAFAFTYPHMLEGWRSLGAELSFFSPLNDEGPAHDCDAVFLPGGYPELHGGALSEARTFHLEMRGAAERGVLIYGECGGYMTLGKGLVDADGQRHEMLGLLPLETSFADRKLHLGYRRLECLDGAPWTGMLGGHEFHYASTTSEGSAEPLFMASDSTNENSSRIGLRTGRVMGSFAHVIGSNTCRP